MPGILLLTSFALAVLYSWDSSPRNIYQAHFLTSFKSLLRCHLPKEAQPDTRVNYVYCLSLPLPVYKLYENGDFCLELCLAHRRLIFSNICGLIEVNKWVLSVYSLSGYVLRTGNKMKNKTQSLTYKSLCGRIPRTLTTDSDSANLGWSLDICNFARYTKGFRCTLFSLCPPGRQ